MSLNAFGLSIHHPLEVRNGMLKILLAVIGQSQVQVYPDHLRVKFTGGFKGVNRFIQLICAQVNYAQIGISRSRIRVEFKKFLEAELCSSIVPGHQRALSALKFGAKSVS